MMDNMPELRTYADELKQITNNKIPFLILDIRQKYDSLSKDTTQKNYEL